MLKGNGRNKYHGGNYNLKNNSTHFGSIKHFILNLIKKQKIVLS